MTDKFWKVIATLAIIVALGVAIFRNGSPVETPAPLGGVGTRFPNGLGVGSASMELRTNFFQASSSALFTGNATFYASTTQGVSGSVSEYSRGGIRYADVRQAYSSGATSTPCSIYNPLAATSTLVRYIPLNMTVASTSNLVFGAGTSTTRYGTSTPALVWERPVKQNFAGVISWKEPAATTTTNVLAADAYGVTSAVIAPTEWVNVKFIGSGVASSSPTSSFCSATFMAP